MRYHVRGDGPPIVFLHGWCLNQRMWIYAEEAFASTHRVVLPDLPGFGRSEEMAGPYTLERYAHEVGRLLDEAELRDATLVGFAFGACVAMTLAAQGHPRLRSLISIAPPGAEHSPYAKMPKAMRRDWPDFARRSAAALLHRPASQATQSWIERMFAATPLSTAAPVVELLAQFDPRTLSSRIACRHLFVHAQNDGVAPVDLGRYCAAAAPDATLTVVSDCGHLIPIDAPADLHGIIAGFLASTGRIQTGGKEEVEQAI